jgi:DNA-binding FrmR family transcriptional regulator
MTLTRDEMVAAQAAQRLLDDEHLKRIFNRIAEDAGEAMILAESADAREASRQMVLALRRIRGEMEADAQMPEADKEAEQHARAME